jgi:hypothetical protein
MKHRTVTAGVAVLALAVLGSGAAIATGAAAPNRANVVAVTSFQVKANRYVKDNLRWAKDSYTVRSGGTVHVVNSAADEGPHTFTVVKQSDLPKTPAQMLGHCKICDTLGQAHGADPNSDAPPKFAFLENGVGQATAPSVDAAGDSAFVEGKKAATVDLKVTAKKGTTLYFMCLIHPWMQAKVIVG